MAEFTRAVGNARGEIEIQKELKTKNGELPENRRIGFLRPQNAVLLALGFIGTFPFRLPIWQKVPPLSESRCNVIAPEV